MINPTVARRRYHPPVRGRLLFVCASLAVGVAACDGRGGGNDESAEVPASYSIESTGAVAFTGTGSVRCVVQTPKNRKEWRVDKTADGYALTLTFPDLNQKPDSAEFTLSKDTMTLGQGTASVQQAKVGGSITFNFGGSYSGTSGSSQLEGRGTCVEREG